jgi:hypothetical protein
VRNARIENLIRSRIAAMRQDQLACFRCGNQPVPILPSLGTRDFSRVRVALC